MASPEPPVALSDHCSIIHDNVLYVYSPLAFQTLALSKNATWSQEENGVSVTGALCIKGGLDGDSNNPALYIVGGATNGSDSTYSGLQRYSIKNKRWETINPISAVTRNRLNHGAAYMNASSAILIYGGSQNGDAGYSTETFLMLMYPPYRVQAYSSIAPAVKRPFLLPFTEDKALMVGGGNGNQKVFTFHPDPGWVDLGVTLPNVLPDPSLAQVNLQALTDGTRILQTFYTNEIPNRVSRNILTNPGFVPAPYGSTIGDGSASGSSRLLARQIIQGNYPVYNNTNAPRGSRTGASLSSDPGLVALVGGDRNSTLSIFNSSSNSWVDSESLFGKIQQPLTVSSSSASVTPTSSPTQSASMISTASVTAAAKVHDSQSNSLRILGGVLGGICGLAAILIIALLWLRSVKRRKAHDAAVKNKSDHNQFSDDKRRGLSPENGLDTPLSQQAQPMGRSPVPSAIITDRDSLAMFGPDSAQKQTAEPQSQRSIGSKLNPAHGASNSLTFFKSNNKTPLQISKPMLPNLGDYQDRPSVDLGKATPSHAPVLPPVAVSVASQHKSDQRKTDEGWAKYFQADKEDQPKQPESNFAVSFEDDPRRSTSRPNTAKGGGTGFWPGSGAPSSSNRSTKLPTRDSAGNVLTHSTVTTASPSLAVGPENPQTRNMSVAAPAKAKFSSADSISTDHTSDDDYEDDEVDTYSDVRDSAYQQHAWNPVGSTWSGPTQRPLRPPSVRIGATAYPPPTSMSEETNVTSSSGVSSIPAFPLPQASIGRADTTDQYTGTTTVQRPQNAYTSSPANGHARKSSNAMYFTGGPPVQDYFGPPPTTASSQGTFGQSHDSNDMSWLNLGTPAHVHANPRVSDARDPA